MKKIYRISQLFQATGRMITGFDMYKYGLTYNGGAGTFLAKRIEEVDLMLAAVERHPELHIVTTLCDGRTLNRYESKDADYYHLHLGNADPEIEFTDEWSASDYTQEQWARHQQMCEDFLKNPWTIEDIAAVNWILKNG